MKNKLLISLAILFYVGLQGFVVLGPQPEYGGSYYWPFVDYPMYRYPHYRGSPVDFFSVYAVHEDGTENLLTLETLDLSYWKFYSKVIKSINSNNPENLRPVAKYYEEKTGNRVKAFRLENRPLLVTEKGTVPGRPYVVQTVSLR